jgi:hypothetical protein
MGWIYSMRGEIRNAYKIVIGNPERKRTLWRPRSRWENNFFG